MVTPGETPDDRDHVQALARTQLDCLRSDFQVVCQGKRGRSWNVIFSEAFMTVAFYRLNRAAFLRFGRGWSVVRAVLAPLNPLIRVLVPTDLDYRADIGAGFRILHPQLGVVVAPGLVAGTGLVLAGGNALGGGSPVLGNNVQLGVNAVVIGDVTLGNDLRIGAGAVVVGDFEGPATLVGVPATAVLDAVPPGVI